MRIIAGKWRSRRLHRPRTSVTRPMPDRLKEAIFAMLGNYFDCPGELPPISVADVFSGSGSMGLEALSRGAKACCFFERDRQVLESLRKNIEELGAAQESKVIVRSAWRAALADPEGHPFDLILLDPPYRESEDSSDSGHVFQYLKALTTDDSRPLVVLHHASTVQFEITEVDVDAKNRWCIIDRRKFGSSTMTVFSL